jgi:probable blue pigment (indigoidine) exporter
MSVSSPQRWLVAAYVVCAVIWGTTWFAIRVSLGPDGYPVLESLAIRFALATAILLPIAARCRPWPRGARAWTWLGLAGALNAFGYLLVYVGEQEVSGGVAAVLYGTQPVVMALVLAMSRSGQVCRSDVAGALTSLLGVVLLFLDRLDASWGQALGLVLIVASVVISVGYLIIMKQQTERTHPVAATTGFVGMTAMVLVLVVLVRGSGGAAWRASAEATLALGYLVLFGTVLAFLAYFWLLSRVSLMTTGTLVFVFPIIALLVDAVWEETVVLQLRSYLGIALTLAGLAVSLAGRRRRTPVHTSAPAMVAPRA